MSFIGDKYRNLYKDLYPHQSKVAKAIAEYFEALKLYCYDLSDLLCIFNAKEQASAFYHSDDFNKLNLKIYEIIKPFDNCNVLNPEDICVYIDYADNYEKIQKVYGYGQFVARDFGYDSVNRKNI